MLDQMRAPLDYYASPGRHTDIAGFDLHAGDIADAVRIVHGLLVYDLVAEGMYNVNLPSAQADTVHERTAAGLLQTALSVDSRPLDTAREPARCIGGRCNTFTLLTVALLRAARIPARARCGSATYFLPGSYEDHWVAEYWNEAENSWQMIDAQLDET